MFSCGKLGTHNVVSVGTLKKRHKVVKKFLTFLPKFEIILVLMMRDWLASSTTKRAQPTYLERVNIMKRIVSNIQNLGFTIVNAPSEDKKVKQGGIILDQTLVNGQSQGVSVRLINGTKKTAAVKLDKGALQDLLTAVNEVLATEG